MITLAISSHSNGLRAVMYIYINKNSNHCKQASAKNKVGTRKFFVHINMESAVVVAGSLPRPLAGVHYRERTTRYP